MDAATLLKDVDVAAVAGEESEPGCLGVWSLGIWAEDFVETVAQKLYLVLVFLVGMEAAGVKGCKV